MPAQPSQPALPVPGFAVGAIASGIKKNGNPDLILIASEGPSTVAGVFTQNVVRAAPVFVSEAVVKEGKCSAIVANAGNANACTGKQGETDAALMAAITANVLQVLPGAVAVASTGVIGQPLPMDKVGQGIADLAPQLRPDGWEAAADAIRTTDLVPKWHSVQAEIDGQTVTMTGIGKGSGMIHPNMATMLGFIATDAKINRTALQAALARAVGRTFNRITVDGDTSTNDCVIALAGGKAGNGLILENTPQWDTLTAMLEEVCGTIAQAIVADGEGATKLVTITVEGADTERDAEAIARQIATSSLVKTALFAADPNWGRILAAAGQAGVPFDPDHVSLHFDHHCLYAGGAWQGQEAEDQVGRVMAKDAYTITMTIGTGSGLATVWTCDLSYDYVRINAEYRT